MTAQSRQPAGVPTGGRFAPQTHAEANVTLDPEPPADPEHTPPQTGGFRPYDNSSWKYRPVHDLMTEMAPDLASQVRAIRFPPIDPPPEVTRRQWDDQLGDLGRSFDLAHSLKDRSFLGPVEEVEFNKGMETLRSHAHDGRLAAHLSSTVTPALDRFADHLAARRARSSEIFAEHSDVTEEWDEPSERENEARECSEAFAEASKAFTESGAAGQGDETKERTERAANWLADNYLRLWT